MIQEFLINGTILMNGTNAGINNSNPTNITIRLINDFQAMNLSARIENSIPWYYSPLAGALAGVIVGAFITTFVTLFLSERQKKDELKRYEYRLLARTLRFLDSIQISNELKNKTKNIIYRIYDDPKLNEVKSRNLIINALNKLESNMSFSEEKEKMEKRFKELKDQFTSKTKL